MATGEFADDVAALASTLRSIEQVLDVAGMPKRISWVGSAC